MLGVWLAIGVYLVLFFREPLASLPAAAGEVVRRVDVLQTILVGDEIVREWFVGASWQGVAQRAVIVAVAAGILLVACAAGWICLRACAADRTIHGAGTVCVLSGRSD